MFVTLDVSQFKISALNVPLQGALDMSLFMSVTADTFQLPIVSCVASAAASLVQNSTSAAATSALVANTVADAT